MALIDAAARSNGTVRVTDTGSATAQTAAATKKAASKPSLTASSKTGGPGTVVVTLHLTTTAARTLCRHHPVKVKTRITFTPTGGKAASTTKT